MHPLSYDSVSGSETIFKNLNKICLVILGFEVPNCVLAHLKWNYDSFSKICEFT